MAKLAFSVIVDDAHMSTTQSIAAEIRHHGFTVDRVIPGAGAIRAIGEVSGVAALRHIDGVMEVTPERTVTLPPMDHKIPQ